MALKELWLSPRMANHDLQTRLRRVEEFVSDGNKVMLRVKFKGREMANPGLGHRILEKAFAILGDKVGIERDVKFEGRSLTVILGKNKGVKKDENQT
ncbi:MAG: Translation initiation factor IF-3 [Candidatus Daviesbacteria bacterium GW2011_GWA2_38_24]|uniref:Translation initiation factor IF-3 n=1 Tax=Candidatus Daviesbacteria bacterium GW2011_GWA2_38_24 TaxID=1618422 RepID=A0A0G0JEZ5_9BACT|nr:MAG: Translation initiation factor IF-3 [Candidatus Daviesbacteria bacterium GW2011_GWA2_38_24]KKQ79140.1 MAG: Translation initiation factor IF-3 [Candidatus Daviesbacteria bacterium GW2011_GWA1_38_7]